MPEEHYSLAEVVRDPRCGIKSKYSGEYLNDKIREILKQNITEGNSMRIIVVGSGGGTIYCVPQSAVKEINKKLKV